EDFGPEVVFIFRHVLEAQAAVGTEIVVGDELVGFGGALLFLGAVERFGDDDFVLFVEILAGQHHFDDVFLELVGEFLDFGVAAARAGPAAPAAAAATTESAAGSRRRGGLGCASDSGCRFGRGHGLGLSFGGR